MHTRALVVATQRCTMSSRVHAEPVSINVSVEPALTRARKERKADERVIIELGDCTGAVIEEFKHEKDKGNGLIIERAACDASFSRGKINGKAARHKSRGRAANRRGSSPRTDPSSVAFSQRGAAG